MQFGQLITAVALGAAVISASAATAQSLGGPMACGERQAMVQRLAHTFGEVQKGAGLVNAGQLVEVWRSDDTGTWTILMTDPEGMSCIVAAGEAWRDVDGERVAKGDPA